MDKRYGEAKQFSYPFMATNMPFRRLWDVNHMAISVSAISEATRRSLLRNWTEVSSKVIWTIPKASLNKNGRFT